MLQREVAAALENHNVTLALINIGVTIAFSLAIFNYVNPQILGVWVAVQICLNVVRIAVFRGDPPMQLAIARSDPRLILFALLSGITWGSSSLLLPESTSILVTVAVPAVLCGMSSGAIIGLSSEPKAIFAFLIAAALPYLVVQIALARDWAPLMISFALIYVIGLSLIGRQLNRVLIEAQRLGRENKDLVRKLDIANRSLARQLDAQRSELDALLATIPAYVWITNRHDHLSPKMSNYAIQHLQLGECGLQKVAFQTYQQGQLLPKKQWPLIRALQGETVSQCELQLRFEDGQQIDQIINAAPVIDEHGETIGAVGAGIDITVRKRAEEELKRSEARFHDFARSASDWLWETDVEHRFTWMSENVKELTGIPAGWHYQKTRFDLLRPDADMSLWAAHRKTLDARLPFRDLEYLRKGPNGDQWLSASGIPIFDNNGDFVGYRGVGRDITERKTAEQHNWHLANHDPLTNLPNRRLLDQRLKVLCEDALATSQLTALAIIDVDHFKEVNDTFGHQVGDKFLTNIGHRLKECIGDRGMVARFGGDEFAIAIDPFERSESSENLAKEMLRAMHPPVEIDQHIILPSISIGVALFPEHTTNTEQLMRIADRALYRAKKQGRNRACIHQVGSKALAMAQS